MQATVTLTLQVNPGAITVTTLTPPIGTVGQSYSYQMAATGGTPPYTWTGANLPPGLSISTGGLISGTPTSAGSFNPSITCVDVNG